VLKQQKEIGKLRMDIVNMRMHNTSPSKRYEKKPHINRELAIGNGFRHNLPFVHPMESARIPDHYSLDPTRRSIEYFHNTNFNLNALRH